ncbi:unnamed protein product [Prorocentrum cordatum]|uniref:Tubulin--tyrosine ligase-like protein 9 n=1 Tax=Prorocentrum cordatum TaxID=2364126 RepID=A0ABN9R8D4_9DINO|nr:unnamed protein product [Polarella glacialis]
MTTMKEVIEDPALFVAVEDSQTAAPVPVDLSGKPLRQKYFYCTNCRVGGHGQRYCEYFLERPDWRVYPSQTWFEDDQKGIEYHCPLGKKLVDFADESHFSRIAMYLRGRVWLEGKTNVLQICDESVMPKTYIIERGQWSGDPPPHDDQVADLPWFVKESDRNWGTSVHLCGKPSECLRLAKPDATYVVQQHVADPLLLDDGRKCHIKFYVLLTSMEDGVTWRVYTYREGYLSISPNVWSPGDLSKAWPDAYPKCKAAVARIIRKAVTDGKLEGRLGKKQFEIFSADFMMDIHGKAWFFEFNMSPVLKDPKDEPRMNDAEMIRAALHVVPTPSQRIRAVLVLGDESSLGRSSMASRTESR